MSDEQPKRPPGRPIDLEKEALKKELGIRSKKYSKQDLLDIKAKRAAKAEQKRVLENMPPPPPPPPKPHPKRELVESITGPLTNVQEPADLEIPYPELGKPTMEENPLVGLSEQQQLIAKLRMRGFSQNAIAKVLGITQAWVSMQLSKIREWQIEHGANIHQAQVVGQTRSVYEDVAMEARKIFDEAETVDDKKSALTLLMQANEKHVKLLMDLGLLKKASTEVKHTLEVSPFIQSWKTQEKRELADSLVARHLEQLPEPTLDIEDAEIIDDDDDDTGSEDSGN